MRNAEYYRDYRAKKKAQKTMLAAKSTLFAKVGNDEETQVKQAPKAEIQETQERKIIGFSQPVAEKTQENKALESYKQVEKEMLAAMDNKINLAIAPILERLEKSIEQANAQKQDSLEAMDARLSLAIEPILAKIEEKVAQPVAQHVAQLSFVEKEKKEKTQEEVQESLAPEAIKSFKDEVLSTMGDIIDFPREKNIPYEDAKEQLICEVLEVAMQRYYEAIAQPRNVPKTVVQRALEVALLLRNNGSAVALGIFVLCNTIFLIFQQSNFYLAAGFSAVVAIATALLVESALVLQSFLLSRQKGMYKMLLSFTTAATVFTAAKLLHTGILSKTNSAIVQSSDGDAIRKRISTLEALEASSIASIQALDAEKYPTKIEALKSALNAPGGYSYEIGELRKELKGMATMSAGVANAQAEALVYQQWLCLLLNIVLAHLLGAMLRSPLLKK